MPSKCEYSPNPDLNMIGTVEFNARNAVVDEMVRPFYFYVLLTDFVIHSFILCNYLKKLDTKSWSYCNLFYARVLS